MNIRAGVIGLLVMLVLGAPMTAWGQMPDADAIRVHEFYRLAPQIEDKIWPGWSSVPDPLLLVTPDAEYLMKFPSPPKDFRPIGHGVWTRPRQLGLQFQATLPLFGLPAVILIGEPENTASKTSTPWEIVTMHEHFHQLQEAQPGYFDAVNGLGLSGNEKTGMWMLNYPFPYAKPEIVKSFGELRDQLLRTLNEKDAAQFRKEGDRYLGMRKEFFAQLAPNDRKYLSFQLWQEGIARYTQIQAGEAAANYEPTESYRSLPDYESFAEYAPKMREQTLEELKMIDIAKAGRGAVYSFGAVEGLFLDRWNPQWRGLYFKHLLTTDEMFAVSTR